MGVGAGDHVPKSGARGWKPRRAGLCFGTSLALAVRLRVASSLSAPRPRSFATDGDAVKVDQDHALTEVTCPCCGARLKVDAELGKVIAHQPPPSRHHGTRDLDRASQLLQKEEARRETHFRQSAEEERIKSQLLERKFEEALRKTKGEPVTPPTREIDLD